MQPLYSRLNKRSRKTSRMPDSSKSPVILARKKDTKAPSVPQDRRASSNKKLLTLGQLKDCMRSM